MTEIPPTLDSESTDSSLSSRTLQDAQKERLPSAFPEFGEQEVTRANEKNIDEPAARTITLTNSGFDPLELEIKVGDTVNGIDGRTVHTITSGSGPQEPSPVKSFDSGFLSEVVHSSDV